MTKTSHRLRALASSLIRFEEADALVYDLHLDARTGRFWNVEDYMDLAKWNGQLSPWRKTVQEELQSIYQEYIDNNTKSGV